MNMNAQMVQIDLSIEAYNLKTLSKSLFGLMEDLEFCPVTNEIYEKLLQVEDLSEQIRKLIELMEAMKEMSVI